MTPEEQAIRADERRKCVEEIRSYSERWFAFSNDKVWSGGINDAADCINRDWPRLSKIKTLTKRSK